MPPTIEITPPQRQIIPNTIYHAEMRRDIENFIKESKKKMQENVLLKDYCQSVKKVVIT
jgi:hypothetical protein